MNQEIKSFGDVRSLILETIVALRNEEIDVSRGMAIAAHFKVLNDNIQVEINAAKLSLQAEGSAHDFGRIVRMGQRMIGGSASAPESE